MVLFAVATVATRRVMGWLRLVGSLKLQVSFAEYSLFYRALLQNRPVILRGLLIVATPYDMTHPYVWHASFLCVTCLIHMCDMTHPYVWHDSFTCVTWHIDMCDMNRPNVWHDSIICVTWIIHMCDMTHSYVWHDSFTCVTWLIHMCDMPHLYM